MERAHKALLPFINRQTGSKLWYKYEQVETVKTYRCFKFAIAFVKIYNILPAIFAYLL